jgi:hypothetical protein
MKRALVLSAVLAALSACGGGGSGTVASPSAQQKAAASTVMGSVVLSIPATAPVASSKVRYPQFVSPNAASVTLSVNGGAVQTFDVSATSSLCVTSAGARDCTLSFAAPVGSDTFVFAIYAGANATGKTLASGTQTQPVVAGSPFSFTVAMNAVLGTIVINLNATQGTSTCQNTPQNQTGIQEGCAGTGTLVFTVFDPSGAQITGTTPFAAPGVITTSDPAITATPNQITAPGQNVLLSYSGGVLGASVTNTITITLNAGANTSQFTLPVQRQYLYVANSNAPFGTAAPGGGNIAVYSFGASGTATPVRTIAGALTQLANPVTVTLDASGDLYVLDNGTYTTQSHPVLLEFAPDINGNVAPIREISGLASVTGNLACESMILDPTKTYLFVVCDDAKIHVFPASGNGGALTLQSAVLSAAVLTNPVTAAFDALGNLYVSDLSHNAIYFFPTPLPTTGGSVAITSSSAMNGGTSSWPANVSPLGLAIDFQGTLFATIAYASPSAGPPDANNQLAIWRTSVIPCSNCQPTAALTGTPFAHAPAGVTFDAAGIIYVSNPFLNNVTEFTYATTYGASGATANPTVLRTINTGSSPDSPTGLVVGP